jgi:catechol 2,3-dioxygenase-like lactoylglutathione lyase family enzyme
MKFLSLAPFVPSGPKFEESKQLFRELGFNLDWDAGDYAGFGIDGCHFILQKFDQKAFAENFMLTVRVDNVEEFRNAVIEKKLPERFGIRIGNVSRQPYGKEVNLIDIAGVCWHFVQ